MKPQSYGGQQQQIDASWRLLFANFIFENFNI